MTNASKIYKKDILNSCRELLAELDQNLETLRSLAEQGDDNSKVVFECMLNEGCAKISTLCRLGLISFDEAQDMRQAFVATEDLWKK